jgi:hypothetical protein
MAMNTLPISAASTPIRITLVAARAWKNPMRPNVINLIDNDMPDINDKLTAAELQRLRLRFLLERWGAETNFIDAQAKPSRANELKCPFTREDADALRFHADDLIALAERIDSLT